MNNRFNCYKKMEDLEKAMEVKHEAEVDIACGELKNVKTHLEYAIREGG